jgi:hypothetical protein
MDKNLMELVYLTPEYKLHLVEEDPVRAHLHKAWRIQNKREVMALETDGVVDAVICVAYTDEVARDERDLQALYVDAVTGSVAMFYTVWAYTPGAGRKMVHAAATEAKAKGAVRFVTLSPQTEMARRFHLRNGAELISTNQDTLNFEYTL